MSIIQKIRDKAAILVFTLIALSLLAFILQDAFVGKTGNQQNLDDNIGKIGSIKIDKTEFDKTLNNYISNYKRQGIDVKDELKYILIKNVWDGLVDSKIIEIDAKNIGINISQKEFNSMFFGENVLPQIKQQFTDPKTGIYDEKAVKDYLSQIKKLQNDNPEKQKFLETFVKPILDNELKQKLNKIYTNSIYIPTWYKNKIEIDINKISKSKIVFIPYSNIKDNNISITEEQVVSQYKKENPKDVSEFEKKNIDVVDFEIIPNKSDSLFVYQKLLTIKEKIKNSDTKEEKKIFLANSADKNYLSNYIKLKDLSEQQKKLINNIKGNEILGPLLENSKYTLFKIIEKKEIPDSVECRHILIASGGESKRLDEDAKKIIDSMPIYLKKGLSFEQLVNKYSEDEGSKSTKGQYTFSYNQYGGIVKEFADAIFLGKTGDKKIIKSQFGYHYLEILKQKNPTAAFKLGIINKPIDARKETIDSVYQLANNFRSKVNSRKEFLEIAVKNNLKVQKITLTENDYTSKIGFCRPVVKWAFENKKDNISNIISIGNKLYISIITEVIPKGNFDKNSIPQSIKNSLVNKIKAQEIIKKNADINDIETIAKKNELQIYTIDSIKFDNQIIGQFGYEPKLSAGLVKNQNNKIGVVEGLNGVYYFTNEIKANPNFKTELNIKLSKMQNNLKGEIWNQNLTELKLQNKIVDLKNKYY